MQKYVIKMQKYAIKYAQFNKKSKATPMLDQFGEDLTVMAADGKLDPIIGREKEVYRICQIQSQFEL